MIDSQPTGYVPDLTSPFERESMTKTVDEKGK